jgi:exoribonuclease R
VINSKCKLSFEIAEAIIAGQISTAEHFPSQDYLIHNSTFEEIQTSLMLLAEITQIRRNFRLNTGSINLDIGAEKEFELDPKTKRTVSWKYKKDSISHQMVEECSLWANIVTGQQLIKNFPKLALLRSHDEPRDDLLRQFVNMLPDMASNIPNAIFDALKGNPHLLKDLRFYPTNIASLFDKSKKPFIDSKSIPALNALFNQMPELYKGYANNLILKSFPPAHYIISDNNPNPESSFHHYAKNFNIYTHFTKPTSRYTDLLAHRMLSWLLEGKDPNDNYTSLELITHCRNANKSKSSTEEV